jgi:two-component system LytT family response regulator/two-component system response regulator AlgR
MSGSGVKAVVVMPAADERRGLVQQLRDGGCAVAQLFPDAAAAQAWLGRSPGSEAVFLDLRVPDLEGLAALKALAPIRPVVVTSWFRDYAVEAYDVGAADFLLKPLEPGRLRRALLRIEGWRAQAQAPAPRPSGQRYPVVAGSGVILVDLRATTHFEVEEEVVWAHAGGRLRTRWKSLAEVETEFKGAGLIRIHRHLLVRPEAVRGLRSAASGRALILLTDGTELAASRGGAPLLRRRFGIRRTGAGEDGDG